MKLCSRLYAAIALLLLATIEVYATDLTQYRILIVNSDNSVGKYAAVQQAFQTTLNAKNTVINLADGNQTLQATVARTRPHLIYAIGSKAYTQAIHEAANQPIIFSSLINWQRFPTEGKKYGVALELPAEMQLFMYSYLFPEVRKIGVLYSAQHNKEWFTQAVAQAREVGITLRGTLVNEPQEIQKALQKLLPTVDALWLISDPVVLYEVRHVQAIFSTADAQRKPIFAYDTLFSKYGAVLTLSADIPTMGRQAAGIASDVLRQQTLSEKVQPPAGSHITLNLKKVHAYGLKINHAALSSVENILR